MNAPRPSEHPPVRGKKSKRLVGGIIGCKNKASSRHLNGSPDGVLNFCLFRAVKTVRLVLKMYRVISSCCKENVCLKVLRAQLNFVFYVIMEYFFLCNILHEQWV